MPLSRDIQELIDAYADGNLDKDDAGKLVELLENSEEVREQLAFAAVVERLLKAMGRGAVETGQIMSQIKENNGKVHDERSSSRRTKQRLIVQGGIQGHGSKARQRKKEPGSGSRMIVLACLIIAAIFTGTFMWNKWEEIKPSDLNKDPQTSTTTTTGKPTTTTTISQVNPNDGNNNTRPIRIGHRLQPFLPVKLPPPPVGENLTPPSGNGEKSDGFVPPPSDWIKAAEKTLRSLDNEEKNTDLVPSTSDWLEAAENELRSSAPPSEVEDIPKAPVLCMKVQHGALREWGVTPDDIQTLLEEMKDALGVRYGMTLGSLDNLKTDPGNNPILFFTGHYNFVFSRAQRQTLRKFIIGGGMIIFNPGLGSKPFYDSARRELRMIIPELPIERLGTDHPIFHSSYNLYRVNYCKGVRDAGYSETTPWLEGITISCRTAVVISRWGMAAGWEGKEDDSFRAYRSKDATQLGINLMTYGASIRAWVKRTSHLTPFRESVTSDTGSMIMAQIKHDREWRTRYSGLTMLLHSFNQRTEVPVKLDVRSISLTDSGLFNIPLLYLTGHEALVLKKEERDALKQYIKNGGFLFAEACCGRKGFDRDFRILMAQMFPSTPLTAVPANDAIFKIPNEIKFLGVTPALGATYGSMLISPGLEGIKVDGNYAVIYSPHGLAGSWEMSQTPYASGYDDPDAMKLGQNILMYAITQ